MPAATLAATLGVARQLERAAAAKLRTAFTGWESVSTSMFGASAQASGAATDSAPACTRLLGSTRSRCGAAGRERARHEGRGVVECSGLGTRKVEPQVCRTGGSRVRRSQRENGRSVVSANVFRSLVTILLFFLSIIRRVSAAVSFVNHHRTSWLRSPKNLRLHRDRTIFPLLL